MAAKFKDGLKFYINYHKLNSILKKNYYLLPLIKKTLMYIVKIKIFIKINIRQAFHWMRMHPNNKDLTTFHFKYKLYKYQVHLFRFINSLTIF